MVNNLGQSEPSKLMRLIKAVQNSPAIVRTEDQVLSQHEAKEIYEQEVSDNQKSTVEARGTTPALGPENTHPQPRLPSTAPTKNSAQDPPASRKRATRHRTLITRILILMIPLGMQIAWSWNQKRIAAAELTAELTVEATGLDEDLHRVEELVGKLEACPRKPKGFEKDIEWAEVRRDLFGQAVRQIGDVSCSENPVSCLAKAKRLRFDLRLLIVSLLAESERNHC